jgi:hypothetical protein
VQQAEWVLDFHEGWGWHQKHPESYGSTLIPGTTGASEEVASKIVEYINTFIETDWKQFLNYTVPAHHGTLRAFCNDTNTPYILVETTGQNDIQSLDIRKKQCVRIIEKLCDEIGITLTPKFIE